MEVSTVTYRNILGNSNILKPNYHLNYGKKRITNAIKRGMPIDTLKACTTNVYTGGIFKRIFVEDSGNGIPYISAQHMMHFDPLEVAKFISKKFTPRQEDMTLKTGQILVSCAGTVGNVRIVDSFLDGVVGSQDIIRVIADNPQFPNGYIYAYLCTPTAYNFIQSFIYGSVVPRIDPYTLCTLPVPILEMHIQNLVNEKMVKASLCRENAQKAITSAVKLLEDRLPHFSIPKVHIERLSSLVNGRKRLDATYSESELESYHKKILQTGANLKDIASMSENVFTPGIFKRIKVEATQNCIPYLGGAELLHHRPIFDTFLSRKTKNLDTYVLKRGYLAFQDSGSIQSIGYVSLIPDYCDSIAATNNLVRVVPKEDESLNNYIFAYCKTTQANSILKSFSYGTGQLHIDTDVVKAFKIPIYSELLSTVDKYVLEYQKMIETAFLLENEAIQKIEKEIDKWQE